MAKQQTRYECRECGHVELRLLGKCPACEAWNTLDESTTGSNEPAGGRKGWRQATGNVVTPVPIGQIDATQLTRIAVEPDEFSRVLGGGLVPGSLVLLGGAPGVGKSTLLTMLAAQLASRGSTVVYLSAEESGAQVRGRAERLGALHDSFLLVEEPSLERVLPGLVSQPPTLLVVDSIQTVFSEQVDGTPGGMAQIRMTGSLLADFARTTGCTVVLIGHITKEGDLAGPRLLEHLVDTVLYFEPEAGGAIRIVRAFKNRFGPIGELSVMEMSSQGLTPIRDASGLFLRGRRDEESGSAVTAIFTGSRPFLVEIQALLAKTNFGIPARVVAGIDSKRVALLSAVLERHGKLQVSDQDVYIKVAGGLRVEDPAADLALIAAMASSRTSRPVASNVVLMGEVGLTGEMRPLTHLATRLSEVRAQGFTRAIVPAADRTGDTPDGIEVTRVHDVNDALRHALRAKSGAEKG